MVDSILLFSNHFFVQVARQMQLFRGITPMLYEPERAEPWTADIDNRVQFAVDFGKKNK